MNQELGQELLQAFKLEAQEQAKDNFSRFCREILGYKDMNDIHKELCSILSDEEKNKIILMPRHSFKSCICTVGYSLWLLARESNARILIYSDSATKAEGFLGDVVSHIYGSVEGSIFRKVFGNWEQEAKQETWNRSQIVIKPRTTSSKEPSIDTGGIETSKVGNHYDYIIFDDIVSDVNVTTKAQMDKVADCYKKALSLLKPGGKILLLGTRWHFGDLYGRLIKENEKSGQFKVFIKDAQEKVNGRLIFEDIGLDSKFLKEQKERQGTRIYSALYRNNPTDDETAIFKARDFSFSDVLPTDLFITGTIDPAGQGEDFTAITVIGTDNEMNMHILDIVWQNKMNPSEMIERIITLNYKYKFRVFGVETNFFRGTLEYQLKERMNKEHEENPTSFTLFGIREFKASRKKGEGKYERIIALQPYHENRRIKFPGDSLELLQGAYSELAFQMIQFPNAPHDDILDSLAWNLPLIRKGGVAKKKDIEYNSPAWLERESYYKEINDMKRLPRRLRRGIPSLAFS